MIVSIYRGKVVLEQSQQAGFQTGWILDSSGWIPDSMRWIPDSKVMDSRFHRLKLPGFRITLHGAIQTHIPRRCTSATYQSFLYTDVPTSPLYIGEISVFPLYTDAYTSPLYIGEISVFLIYRRTYLAVVHR